ncbi:Calmodulin-like protein 4 [Plecturocebus cupreus]
MSSPVRGPWWEVGGRGCILFTVTTHCHILLLPGRWPLNQLCGSHRRPAGFPRAFPSAHSAVFAGFLDGNGELDFSTFLTIMHMQIKQEDPKKEILLAMLMADKEKKGYIMASDLRSKLTRLGEKLTHKEVDDLFREAGIEPNGKVKYDEFIHKITLPAQDY